MLVQCRDPASPLGGQYYAAFMPNGSINTMDQNLSGITNPFNEHSILLAGATFTVTTDHGKDSQIQERNQLTDEQAQAEMDEAYADAYGNDDEGEEGDDENE